jgi:hypothetical protein
MKRKDILPVTIATLGTLLLVAVFLLAASSQGLDTEHLSLRLLEERRRT